MRPSYSITFTDTDINKIKTMASLVLILQNDDQAITGDDAQAVCHLLYQFLEYFVKYEDSSADKYDTQVLIGQMRKLSAKLEDYREVGHQDAVR